MWRLRFAFILLFAVLTCSAQADDRPNVLFISVDDLNDWVGVLGGHPQVKTPNIDEFARRGSVVFQNAHCPAPICNASRAALLSGFMPSTTGVYNNLQNMRDAALIQQHATLPEYFSKHGYSSLSRGKIFHTHGTANGFDAGQWAFDQWVNVAANAPVNQEQITSRRRSLIHGQPGLPVQRTTSRGSDITWGPTIGGKEATSDYNTARWAAYQLLFQEHDKPFFLAVGLSRPHLPFHVPQEFFDLYDPQTFKAPEIREDDLSDILVKGTSRPKHKPNADYLWLKQNGLVDEAARAYAAACSYADACVGLILDALRHSPHSRNTIVVLWSDHGLHLGEKMKFGKATAWQRSTRVPLIIRLPGMTTRQDCSRAVNLVDLFPTPIELCQLPAKPVLDGRSLAPLLKDPTQEWNYPSLTVFGYGDASVQDERYHYIRYQDETEELYDLQTDPMEWTNLALRMTSEDKRARDRLAQSIPASFAAELPRGNVELRRNAVKADSTIKATRPLNRLK